jgi:predicted kinase
MIVLMAGLPGSGKTTLARALAAKVSGLVLNKDVIRAALFAESDIEYSTPQDDFCHHVMLETAAFLLQKNKERFIFLDGRTFSRHYQIEQTVTFAESLGQPWGILQCVCSEESARQRLREQASSGTHPARNRDFQLYLHVNAQWEPIRFSKAIIDTDQPLQLCLDAAMHAMTPNRGIQASK